MTCSWVTPGGQGRADRALEDQVGGVAEEAWAEDRQGDADDREREHGEDEWRLRPEPAEQPPERAAEITGLGRGQAHAHAHHHPAARATARTAARPGGRGVGRGACGPAREGAAGPGRARAAHAAASDSESCENTISR